MKSSYELAIEWINADWESTYHRVDELGSVAAAAAYELGCIHGSEDPCYVRCAFSDLVRAIKELREEVARNDQLPCPVCGGILEGNTCCPPDQDENGEDIVVVKS